MAVLDAVRLASLVDACRASNEASVPYTIACGDVVSSTNDEIKRLIREGSPEGPVFVACEQRSGYGRQGRAWTSPVGGVYFSLCLRPEVEPLALPTLSLVSSLSVRAALERLGCAHEVAIKWPNDVVCPEGKLCGISLEAVGGAVCAGIGVNVFRREEPIEVGGKNTPAFSFERVRPGTTFGTAASNGTAARVRAGEIDAAQACVLEAVVAHVLAEFERRYDRWRRDGFGVFREEYNEHLALRGAFVEAVSMTGEVLACGMVERVDEQGLLVLRQDDGSAFSATSGEVHLSKVLF